MKTMQMDHFDKYAFVKAFIGSAKSDSQKKEKEREAVIIAEAIEKNQKVLLDSITTKQDLANIEAKMATKQDLALLEQKLVVLEQKLTIKLTVIMATLLTVLPLITEFVKRSF